MFPLKWENVLALSLGGNYAINLDIYYSNMLLAFLLLMFVRKLSCHLLAAGPWVPVKFSFWLPIPVGETLTSIDNDWLNFSLLLSFDSFLRRCVSLALEYVAPNRNVVTDMLEPTKPENPRFG